MAYEAEKMKSQEHSVGLVDNPLLNEKGLETNNRSTQGLSKDIKEGGPYRTRRRSESMYNNVGSRHNRFRRCLCGEDAVPPFLLKEKKKHTTNGRNPSQVKGKEQSVTGSVVLHDRDQSVNTLQKDSGVDEAICNRIKIASHILQGINFGIAGVKIGELMGNPTQASYAFWKAIEKEINETHHQCFDVVQIIEEFNEMKQAYVAIAKGHCSVTDTNERILAKILAQLFEGSTGIPHTSTDSTPKSLPENRKADKILKKEISKKRKISDGSTFLVCLPAPNSNYAPPLHGKRPLRRYLSGKEKLFSTTTKVEKPKGERKQIPGHASAPEKSFHGVSTNNTAHPELYAYLENELGSRPNSVALTSGEIEPPDFRASPCVHRSVKRKTEHSRDETKVERSVKRRKTEHSRDETKVERSVKRKTEQSRDETKVESRQIPGDASAPAISLHGVSTTNIAYPDLFAYLENELGSRLNSITLTCGEMESPDFRSSPCLPRSVERKTEDSRDGTDNYLKASQSFFQRKSFEASAQRDPILAEANLSAGVVKSIEKVQDKLIVEPSSKEGVVETLKLGQNSLNMDANENIQNMAQARGNLNVKHDGHLNEEQIREDDLSAILDSSRIKENNAYDISKELAEACQVPDKNKIVGSCVFPNSKPSSNLEHTKEFDKKSNAILQRIFIEFDRRYEILLGTIAEIFRKNMLELQTSPSKSKLTGTMQEDLAPSSDIPLDNISKDFNLVELERKKLKLKQELYAIELEEIRMGSAVAKSITLDG